MRSLHIWPRNQEGRRKKKVKEEKLPVFLEVKRDDERTDIVLTGAADIIMLPFVHHSITSIYNDVGIVRRCHNANVILHYQDVTLALFSYITDF